MMPRKTRRMIIIVSITILLLVTVVTLVLLYMSTDMFKSNSTLFVKYLGQNVENMDSFYQEMVKSEYAPLLQQNKYTSETQVKINYTENIGTSSESTQNSVNQLRLKVSGQTDKSNQYNYQDISLLKNEENVANIEYIQNGITYGIKFSDLFNQYILVDNQNLKEFFRKLDYTEEQLENIPDTIEFENQLNDIFAFSEEEKQNLKTKYISIMNSNISKDNFSKQKNQMIQIDDKNVKTNCYVLTMTKEQFNNMYIKLLEEVKQDEIIGSKIDKWQGIFENSEMIGMINLRERFVTKIEDVIADITRNNIGQDETKISVYQNNQTTIRTMVQHPDYEFVMDRLPSQTGDFVQISYQDMKANQGQVFTFKKENGEISVTLEDTENGEVAQYSVTTNEKMNDNKLVKNTVAKCENSSNRIETVIEKEINIVNNFENAIVLDDKNAINLSHLEKDQVPIILDKVKNGVFGKVNEIVTNDIKIEDWLSLFKAFHIVEESQTLEAMGITETEKNRFNSQFEILQGENLDSQAILNLINAIKENLMDMEVVSNTELKLKLDRFNKNEQVATVLSSFIEENKNRKYDARVEYEVETGLASEIVLTMVENH